MTPLAFFLILASAGLHATWNMIAKKSGASLAFYTLLGAMGFSWSQFVRFFTPLHFFSLPPAFHLWLVGMLVGEFCYAFGIRLAYRTLDMSTAYPMMRSIPLLLLSVITAAFGFGKALSAHALIGMAMVFAGCLAIPLRSFSDFRLSRYFDRSFGYILLVAAGTTIYTLCDSQAQRVMLDYVDANGISVSKPLVSLTYYCFRAATLFPSLCVVTALGATSRAETVDLWRNRSVMPFVAGVCSSLTYVLVLVSMNFVTNVAYVQAFRQIGLLFGLAEGVFILKERCTAPKVVGLALILMGLTMSVL